MSAIAGGPLTAPFAHGALEDAIGAGAALSIASVPQLLDVAGGGRPRPAARRTSIFGSNTGQRDGGCPPETWPALAAVAARLSRVGRGPRSVVRGRSRTVRSEGDDRTPDPHSARLDRAVHPGPSPGPASGALPAGPLTGLQAG